MAVTKTIEVDGKEVQFRASAAIPRLYRNKFHRDIYKDLNELQKAPIWTLSVWNFLRTSHG